MLRPDNDGKFPCAMCPETFDGVRALSTHIVKAHRKKIKEYYDIYIRLRERCHPLGWRMRAAEVILDS